jgi:hypothetical protein
MVWPARRAKKLNWCQPVYPYSTALLPDDDSRTVTKMNDPNQQLNNDEQEAAALDALLALLDAPVAVPVPAPVQGQNPVPVPAQVPVPEALRNYQWRVTWYEEGDEPYTEIMGRFGDAWALAQPYPDDDGLDWHFTRRADILNALLQEPVVTVAWVDNATRTTLERF